MKPAAIRLLAESWPLARLEAAEQALLAGQSPGCAVPGDDAGEQLTHVLAAIFIQHYMKSHAADFQAAARVFFQKVREAVS